MGDMPKRAMVLAAGLGMRMRPITLTVPKPLIAVGGQPMLDHVLDRLAQAGVEEAVVNTHWLADKINAHLAARTAPAPRITCSHEKEVLETGGGIRNALPLLGDAPFFTINADIVWLDGPVPALTRLAQAWDPAKMDCLLLVTPTATAIGYDGRGDFHMDPDGLLSSRVEGEVSPFVMAGVAIMKPELFHDRPAGAFSQSVIWREAEAAGRLYGLRHDGNWYHVGTPDAVPLVDAHLRDPAGREVVP
ncbi:nucleotidyltransferase family protein [Niveispirillum irakense]|uniref:nucleotidyltransferase family protein n=1 Tax=Niveispirillum irakense TaxID=34011 RepID=UPI00041AD74F|nr:nucleotidyltransferase family protein [Niveispirillum irakense]